jgi:hypothetical protein
MPTHKQKLKQNQNFTNYKQHYHKEESFISFLRVLGFEDIKLHVCLKKCHKFHAGNEVNTLE